MRRYLSFLCLLAIAVAWVDLARAEGDHIETDRDSFTPAVTTAGDGRLIVEAAYSFIDNRDTPESHSFPELIARYGVNDWLELRVGANYEVGGASGSVSGNTGGFGNIDSQEIETEAKLIYGIKVGLTDQSDFVPQSAAILQGSTPTSGEETATDFVATYVWGWKLTKQLYWDSAVRYGTGAEAGDDFNRWAPSTVLKAEFAEKWTAHVEYFGIFSSGREVESSESYVSPGIHYLINPNTEVGVRVGWGLGADSANFFSNVGIGLRY